MHGSMIYRMAEFYGVCKCNNAMQKIPCSKYYASSFMQHSTGDASIDFSSATAIHRIVGSPLAISYHGLSDSITIHTARVTSASRYLPCWWSGPIPAHLSFPPRHPLLKYRTGWSSSSLRAFHTSKFSQLTKCSSKVLRISLSAFFPIKFCRCLSRPLQIQDG